MSKNVKNKVPAIFINNAPNDATLDSVQRRLDEITLFPKFPLFYNNFHQNWTPKTTSEEIVE